MIRYSARDGLEIEGLLIYPVDYQIGTKFPLVVIVHGGRESHYYNGWLTSYSRPGQVLAGKGYMVFDPNYRARIGYGVEFALQCYGNAAGKEFDDIADGIDYLIKQGIADAERIELMGGSYGGYAAAWFSSYYTKYVKAVCMFVGIIGWNWKIKFILIYLKIVTTTSSSFSVIALPFSFSHTLALCSE